MTETNTQQLLKDINALIAAHDRLLGAKQRLSQEYPGEHEQVCASPSFAAWLYLHGHKTDEQVYAFVKKAWDLFGSDKSQLWAWQTPDTTEPLTDADQLLDRMDMCMGLIAQKTTTVKPVESVRDYGRHPSQHLKRILAFARAANDVIA